MVSVEFRSVGPGVCAWCRKDKEEVATVAFSDRSFVGAMCWKDLQRALGMKLGSINGESQKQIATGAAPAVTNAMPK